MSSRLTGRVCVVTGATGIAAAAARRLTFEGARVFVISVDGEDCERLATVINASGGTCRWVAADLREEADTVAAFARCHDELGAVDGLVAVAGASGRRHGDGPVHDVSLEAWQATFELNGPPAFLAAREAVRAMRQVPPRGGAIVLVSSVLATSPAPELFATHAYAAVKGAIDALTRTMAAYYASDGIRVNALAPGLVDTPMAARAANDPTTVAYASAKQPLAGGLIDAEDVAGAAAFLVSDDARMITGQVIAVDGGWSVAEASL